MSQEAIDPHCTALRPLAEYARRLPSSRAGKRLNRATLWRWALRGAAGKKLRTAMLGTGRVTCDAWVWEFLIREESDQVRSRREAPLDPKERARIARELGARSRRSAS